MFDFNGLGKQISISCKLIVPNVGIGTTNPAFKLTLAGTTATTDRMIGINGTPVVYLPDQGVFSGSLMLGNGGSALAHSSGQDGQFNTGVGVGAMTANTVGNNNTAVGSNALTANTTGVQNNAIGAGALAANTTGYYNTADGMNALNANTTASYNSAFGALALTGNTSGTNNTALGMSALQYNTGGSQNTATGQNALLYSAGGSYNTANGYTALYNVGNGGYNVAVGAGALHATSGSNNTGIGYNALNLATGASNVALGYSAGSAITTGANNVVIGSDTGSQIAASSNYVLIADGAGNRRMTIDNNGNVGIGTTAPTAKLNLAAGSAAAGTAPLKFTSGPLLGTAEDGAMEYNSGTGLWFTIGATRYVIPTNTAAGNYSNVSTIGNSSGSITMTPMAGNSVIVNSATVSTTPTSGALIVSGGVGVSGDINTTGNMTLGGSLTANTNAVIPQIYGSNAASGNIKIDGTSNATKGNVLLATAGGNVGIGTTAPAALLHLSTSSANTSVGGLPGITLSNTNSVNGGVGTSINFQRANTTPALVNYGSIDVISLTSGAGAETGAMRFSTVNAGTLSEKMRIDNSGNIGVGTTTPRAAIQVNSSVGEFVLQNSNVYAPSQTAKLMLNPVGSGAFDTAGFYNKGPAVAGIAETAANYSGLAFYSYNGTQNESMRISNVGNVGIGTTAPVDSLDIRGGNNTLSLGPSVDNTGTVSLYFSHKLAPGSTQNKVSIFSSAAGTWGRSNGLNFAINNVSDSTNAGPADVKMFIDPTGNVGIGTTAPARALEVSTIGGAVVARFSSPGGYATTEYGANAASQINLNFNDAAAPTITRGRIAYDLPADYMAFKTNAGERLRIDSSGNVGIGTTAPSAKLEVNSGAFGAATGINISTTTAGANTYEQYKANGAVIGSITSAAGANVAFNTTSDIRLKGGFEPVLSPLKTLNEIEVTNFYYLADPAHQRMDGFKAQQLYTIAPYAVTKPE